MAQEVDAPTFLEVAQLGPPGATLAPASGSLPVSRKVKNTESDPPEGEPVTDVHWCRKGWLRTESPPQLDLKSELESRARTEEPMYQFQLSHAALLGIDLVRRHSKIGYEMHETDLYHANLEFAHCFKLDLSRSSLMKANFQHANLHCANLTDCNLLGANFKDAKIENVIWGRELLQERQARESKNPDKKFELHQQAEEILRHLRLTAEGQGLFEMAGGFYQREMTMRRLQLPLLSMRRAGSKAADLVCGYGEDPLRVVAFSLLVILGFGSLYFFSGLAKHGEPNMFELQASFQQNLQVLMDSMYFSALTSTTRGYGDVVPIGLSRALAIVQAFIGSFTVALFVVVFVKKMTR